jgi:hypothetical protein
LKTNSFIPQNEVQIMVAHKTSLDRTMMRVLAAFLLMAISAAALAEENLTVLSESQLGVAQGKLLEFDLKQKFRQRIEERLASFESLRSRSDCTRCQKAVELVAIGEAAIPALHAVALHPDRFQKVDLRGMIHSWADVVKAADSENQAVNVVHGALKHYNLPDLIEFIGRDKVQLEQPVDALGK